MKGRSFCYLILFIDVCSAGDEKFHNLFMSVFGSYVKGRI